MMTALLLHGYASGIYSSRRIAKAAVERADFMMIVAGDPPDFRTISEFRRRHLTALAGLFVQVLKLAEKAGLVKLGHVALDGTKIKANASKHKAMSYERMKKREVELAARSTAGSKRPRRPMPRRTSSTAAGAATRCRIGWPTSRSGWPRSARPRPRWRRKPRPPPRRRCGAGPRQRNDGIAEGRKKNGKTPAPPKTEPDGKAQRNFTDPESRILKTKDGYIQGYNAQAAVDAEAQIIVAHGLTPSMSDQDQFVPLLDSDRGQSRPQAQGGFRRCRLLQRGQPCRALAARDIRGLHRHRTRQASRSDVKRKITGPLTKAMRDKLKRAGWRSRYRLRKQIVEPVFGQIKQARGFRQFLLRGIEKVTAEWALICTAHNLTKLATAV